MKESYLHRKLKEKARHWLEEKGYSVQEEVNIGGRVVDVLGTKSDPPKIGIECGRMANKTPPPEGIVIFRLPYENTEPYRWEPPASSRRIDTGVLELDVKADPNNVHCKEYSMYKAGNGGAKTMIPRLVIEHEARKRGISPGELVRTHKIAHLFGGFDDFAAAYRFIPDPEREAIIMPEEKIE